MSRGDGESKREDGENKEGRERVTRGWSELKGDGESKEGMERVKGDGESKRGWRE